MECDTFPSTASGTSGKGHTRNHLAPVSLEGRQTHLHHVTRAPATNIVHPRFGRGQVEDQACGSLHEHLEDRLHSAHELQHPCPRGSHLSSGCCLFRVLRRTRPITQYNTFGKNGLNDGTALVYSPDGSVIYLATLAGAVVALGSNAASTDPALWSAVVGGSNLCDIVVSPDGLSVNLRRNPIFGASIVVHTSFEPHDP